LHSGGLQVGPLGEKLAHHVRVPCLSSDMKSRPPMLRTAYSAQHWVARGLPMPMSPESWRTWHGLSASNSSLACILAWQTRVGSCCLLEWRAIVAPCCSSTRQPVSPHAEGLHSSFHPGDTLVCSPRQQSQGCTPAPANGAHCPRLLSQPLHGAGPWCRLPRPTACVRLEA
jgi:hypothetical protein